MPILQETFWGRFAAFISSLFFGAGFVFAAKTFTRYREQGKGLEDEDEDEEDCTLIYHKKRRHLEEHDRDTSEFVDENEFHHFVSERNARKTEEEANGAFKLQGDYIYTQVHTNGLQHEYNHQFSTKDTYTNYNGNGVSGYREGNGYNNGVLDFDNFGEVKDEDMVNGVRNGLKRSSEVSVSHGMSNGVVSNGVKSSGEISNNVKDNGVIISNGTTHHFSRHHDEVVDFTKEQANGTTILLDVDYGLSGNKEEEDDDDVYYYGVPDEIYLHVFSYLDATMLTSTVQRVCKDWYRLVDDHALWRALVDDLCSESGVPFNLCAGATDGDFSLVKTVDDNDIKSNTWKQRYFVASILNGKNEINKMWHLWLDVLLESSTHAIILGHDFHVCAVSAHLKPSVVDLDDIFKGIGVKGSFPIPRVVHIGMKSFTVLSTMPNNWSLGFWIIARDLRSDTGLIIVKTRKLVLISIKERCDFCGQIQMVQCTLKTAEQLLSEDF